MFSLVLALRNMKRGWIVCLVSVISFVTLALLLSVFTGFVNRTRSELDSYYKELTVTASFSGAKAGSQPRVRPKLFDAVVSNSFVKDHYAAMEKEIATAQRIRGVNSAKADPVLEEYLLDCKWQAGMDETVFSGSDTVCIVPSACEMSIGDKIAVFGNAFRVVGVYNSGMTGNWTYYCPLETLVGICEKNGDSYSYYSLGLALGDLENLDVFKSQMKELGVDEGEATLVINDTLFRECTRNLKLQLRLQRGVLYLVYILTFSVAFVLSFLVFRNRRHDVAVLRSAGCPSSFAFMSLMEEACIYALTGCGIGGLISLAVPFFSLNLRQLLLLFFFCCFGAGAAIYRVVSGSILREMHEFE